MHEGAHYQQLALAWRNPRPVRRHYYDSGANEGIAFYNEEMMLVSGLVDDAPHTRAVLCNFMRLRALRVTVDVGLATGAAVDRGGRRQLAPGSRWTTATAQEEAAFFAETPGQALTYQVGKTQLIAPDRRRGAAARRRPGPAAAARRDLGQRQRPGRPAALGAARPDRRAGRPGSSARDRVRPV